MKEKKIYSHVLLKCVLLLFYLLQTHIQVRTYKTGHRLAAKALLCLSLRWPTDRQTDTTWSVCQSTEFQTSAARHSYSL